MPRTGGDPSPRDCVAEGDWPDGSLSLDAPVSAVYGREFALRHRADHAMAEVGLTLYGLGRDAGVSRRTIERVLAGTVLPDFGAIARLEECLGVELWPGPEIRARRTKGRTRTR